MVDEEQITHPADPPEALVDFVSSFRDEQAQGVMRDAAVRIQDYVTRREIADDNRAMSNRMISNLGQFKDGLANMAYSDPSAVGLGLSLAPDVVRGIIDSNPFLPDDQRDGIATSLISDVKREVARAGVMSLAEKDATAARALLGKVGEVFDERGTGGLLGFIDAMDGARTMDSAAVAAQRAKDAAQTANFSMVQHLSGLVDPKTGEVAFPGGWAQRVIADPSVPPTQTAGMLGLYDRLQKGGDVQSDPHVLAGIIDGIAQGRVRDAASVLQYVGESLSVGDAVGLAYSALNPTSTREMQALSTTIGAARRALAAPENGPAGVVAFGRFVEWLVPAYKAAGAGSLRPDAENSVLPYPDGGYVEKTFWDAFRPNGDDIVMGARRMPRSLDELRQETGDRISLEDIFGGRRPPPAGDKVIRSRRVFNPMRTRYIR